MSEEARRDARLYVEYLRSLPLESRARANATSRLSAEAAHQRFRDHFRDGVCSICTQPLTSFDRTAPCLHWLLVPAGFTKWHLVDVTSRFSMFRLQAFLRWVANEEAVARNINDLSEEGTGKLVELTIRYGDYDWAFSCGEGDYLGHENGSDDSRRPHYHFQMRYKKAAFIRYNDFHIPLHDSDIRTIEATRAAPDFVKHHFAGGAGMSDLLNEDTVKQLVAAGQSGDDEDEALLELETLVMADPGTTISGDDIANLIEEAKAKGVTITSLLPKLKDTRIQTMVTPGPGVVEQAPRSSRKRRPR